MWMLRCILKLASLCPIMSVLARAEQGKMQASHKKVQDILMDIATTALRVHAVWVRAVKCDKQVVPMTHKLSAALAYQ